MISSQSPILIVGAGPVGLSLALALSRAGIPTEFFEADTELNTQNRASTFHPKTLEMFETWGVVDEVIKHGYKVDQLQYWERAPRRLIADFDYDSVSKDTPYPYRLQCPQHIATRVLKPAVEATETGKVHMGHKLVDFTDHGTHITARFESPDGIVERTGSYIVGADGTHRRSTSLQDQNNATLSRPSARSGHLPHGTRHPCRRLATQQ
ncbi:MAG TPA: NAD(P)/FAD-dependent oxidoreductase [Anaerolineales bacterium]|nr:NAD(P)/FAD-dependent oxidoreductase [Anaerolineales bacterium]